MNNEIVYERWEAIYKSSGQGHFLRYPNEVFVTLFSRFSHLIPNKKYSLDYGFGSGNNTEFLMQKFEHIYGIDIATSAIQNLDNRLQQYNNYNPNNFCTSKIENISFDFILAWHVLYYNTPLSFDATLDYLVKALTNDGVIILTLCTHDDMKVKLSKPIINETNTMFVITEKIPYQEGCNIFSPPSIEAFLNLFTNYPLKILDYGIYSSCSFTTTAQTSEYYVVAKKCL